MPSTAMPLGQLLGDLGQLGVRLAELLGARPRTSSVSSSSRQGGAHSRLDGLQGALVGDREGADLLDVVAPELDPERVLLGRREDVDDAAADRELAALLDQVDPGVRRLGQPPYDVVEVDLVADGELDRLQVGQPLDLRLQHGAHRGHDDLERPVAGSSPGWASRRSTASRRPTVSLRGDEPLVRQGLPRREVGDVVRVDEPARARDQVLGLARGRGHREHGAAGVDEPRRPRTAAARRRRSGPGPASAPPGRRPSTRPRWGPRGPGRPGPARSTSAPCPTTRPRWGWVESTGGSPPAHRVAGVSRV